LALKVLSLLNFFTTVHSYATVLRPSVVCNVCIVAKRFVLPKKTVWGIRYRKWPIRNRMVT